MKIPVYLPLMAPTPHSASRSFASQLVSDALAKYLDPADPRKGVMLRVNEPWRALKSRYRVCKEIPKIKLPHAPEPLMIQYPPSPDCCETDGRERQKKLWLSATRF